MHKDKAELLREAERTCRFVARAIRDITGGDAIHVELGWGAWTGMMEHWIQSLEDVTLANCSPQLDSARKLLWRLAVGAKGWRNRLEHGANTGFPSQEAADEASRALLQELSLLADYAQDFELTAETASTLADELTQRNGATPPSPTLPRDASPHWTSLSATQQRVILFLLSEPVDSEFTRDQIYARANVANSGDTRRRLDELAEVGVLKRARRTKLASVPRDAPEIRNRHESWTVRLAAQE